VAAAWTAIAAGLLIMTAVAVTGADVEGWARLPYWGLPALLVVWGALSLEGAGHMPLCKPLKLLGDASYSIYLAHGLALSLAFRLIGGRDLPVLAAVALAAPFGVVAGLACYWLVERPLLAVFHGRRRSRGAQRPAAWPTVRAKASP
jgi:exopolysaccharide production protein ExoZ